jgi:signal transduction histidine kinase
VDKLQRDAKDKLNNHLINFHTRCFRVLGEARTRILLWYLALMTVFIAIALPTIRQRLYAKIQERTQGELIEEVEEFTRIVAQGFKSQDEEDLARLRRRNDQVPWEAPQNLQELIRVLEIHLSDELPDDDVFFIAIIDDKFHKSNPRGLPYVIDANSNLMQRWKKLTQPSQEEVEFDDINIDSVFYIAKPIEIKGKRVGVFVVAHTTAGEREEALEALRVVFEVNVFVLFVALIIAWLVSGKILAPLRTLTTTAREINELELTKRIAVQGGGEIAQLASTFNTMMDRLEVAFVTQRDFINDAGHELRTPITIIRGHLELMGDDPEEQKETLALVMDELDRMSRFVDDLSLLVKAERPDFLHLETFDIASFTEELFSKAKALAHRNWQLDTVARGQIFADRQRLTQVVMNLAQNAAQYTKDDDTIYIGTAISKSKVRFWVEDTGEGIAPSEHKRIFERFARTATSRRRSDGAGLGLSIVKAITQAHGGKVYLKSQLGIGSTFTVVLPLEQNKTPISKK